MNHKVTPEERLLRLIESGGKTEAGETPAETRSKRRFGFWLKIFSRNPNGAFRGVPFFQNLRPELNLRLLNRVLIAVLILVVVGIGIELKNSRTLPEDLQNPSAIIDSSVGNAGNGDIKLASVGPLPEYLDEVAKRDIFAPAPVEKVKPQRPELQQTTPIAPPQPEPVQILQQKVKSLKLVGISWGRNPVAMIEDKSNQQTSFLKVGDSINGLTVKAILRDRAILSHGGAEYDLF